MMIQIVSILFCFSLIPIIVEDFKDRAISIQWFLLMGLLGIGLGVFSNTGWEDVACNGIFLGLQWLLITLYFSLKKREWVNISNGIFGAGDSVFLLCCIPLIKKADFIFYFIAGVIICLVLSVLISLFKKDYGKSIPFAGILGIQLFIQKTYSLFHVAPSYNQRAFESLLFQTF